MVTSRCLLERVQGQVILPEDPAYQDARRVWNGDVDRRPRAIVRCAGVEDVVQAVRFARERDLPASVRGGGHAVAGHAVCDDGVVIDLSAMNAVRVARWRGPPASRAAACTATSTARPTPPGWRSPAGSSPHRHRRAHPRRRHRLARAPAWAGSGQPAVLRGGDRRRRGARRQPAAAPGAVLGLRGGGGNFGVVTSFEYDLHPVGPTVLAGMVLYGIDDGQQVLRRFRDLVAQAPDELGVVVNLRLAPPLPEVPARLHGTPVVALVVCWVGPVEQGEEALRPLRAFGRPLLDTVAPRPSGPRQSAGLSGW
jgi:FAD/FMN-containing dehydrogenase